MDKRILIVINMQYGFLRTRQMQDVAVHLSRLLKKKIFDVVIATRFSYADAFTCEEYPDWVEIKTENGAQLFPEIGRYADAVDINSTLSCVTPTLLDRLIGLNDGTYPTTVYLAGAETNTSVLASAIALLDHRIYPVILSDCCGSGDGDLYHRSGLFCLERILGMESVIDSGAIPQDH